MYFQRTSNSLKNKQNKRNTAADFTKKERRKYFESLNPSRISNDKRFYRNEIIMKLNQLKNQ